MSNCGSLLQQSARQFWPSEGCAHEAWTLRADLAQNFLASLVELQSTPTICHRKKKNQEFGQGDGGLNFHRPFRSSSGTEGAFFSLSDG